MNSPPGSHKAQEQRLLRPKSSSRGRHSTESAPPAFENRTPNTHPRVAFSEAEEPQVDLDRKTGKGRADNAKRPYPECTGRQSPLHGGFCVFNERRNSF